MINRIFYPSERSDRFSRLLKVNIILLLAASIFLRISALDHIPGLQGDEAWYGVQMKQLYHDGSCAWQTPNGNPLNPFFSGILFILQIFFKPHVLVLRAPALLSGLLFILLTYIFTKKMTDPVTATMATMLAAAFPIHIAYSRFGWDASQIGLISCVVIYLAWRGNWLALTAAVLAAFLIHPTTLFLIPIIMVPAVVDIARHPNFSRRLKQNKVKLIFCGVILLVFGIFVIMPLASRVLYGHDILERLLSPSKWYEFLVLFGQLLSGITVSEFIAGYQGGDAASFYNLALLTLFSLLLIIGGRRLAIYRQSKQFAFMMGFVVSLAALFLIAGRYAVIPGQERFAAYLMAPAGLSMAFALKALGPNPNQERLLISAVSIVGWLLVASFQYSYFQTFTKTGGLAEMNFRTASMEPKSQAVNMILASARQQTKGPLILTENFWLYYPIHYLTFDNTAVQTVDLVGTGYPVVKFVRDMQEGAYAVGFPGGDVQRVMQYMLGPESYRRWRLIDYGGHDLIYIWHRHDRFKDRQPQSG